MTPERFGEILQRFGAVEYAGELVAPCPLHQPDQTDPYRFKLVLSPGRDYPVLFCCRHCEIPGDRKGNVKIRLQIAKALGLDYREFCEPAEKEEIEALWKSNYRAALTNPAAPIASPVFLDRVYSRVLDLLPLIPEQQQWLLHRGLNSTVAIEYGYRTAPDADQFPVQVQQLGEEFGTALRTVPGFWQDSAGEWQWTGRYPAILTPCRNLQGQIQAIKMRLLAGRGRVRLLSSGKWGGPHALSLTHCPLGIGKQQWPEIWLTEGERKADVWWAQTGVPAIGVPGVGQWRSAIPILEQLALGKGRVVVALDTDDAGRRALPVVAETLQGLGFHTGIAVWNSEYKGLDDALVAECEIDTHWLEPNRKAAPPHPKTNQQSSLPWVSDWVEYLRCNGPQLRDRLRGVQVELGQLITQRKVLMRKTRWGQCVYLPGTAEETVAEYLNGIT